MAVTALAQWFGSNRLLAHRVGDLLSGCEWVGVPFAGGMSELLHIKARTVVVNDLHRHVINLARVAADPVLGSELRRRIKATLFHQDELTTAQSVCRSSDPEAPPAAPNIELAVAYFNAVWMNRAGKAGINDEFNGRLCVRWNSHGGDSAIRYRSAARSLVEWRRILSRCTFDAMDAFAFLGKCKDEPRHGIYCDPPFPGPGDRYKFNCGIDAADWHERLSRVLAKFSRCLIVCRYYDHPLVRELYRPPWKWIELDGRKQTNETAPEVLLSLNAQNGLFQ